MPDRTPAIRASDIERDAVIERLRDAAGEGRLTFEELADRIELAAGAVTREELDQISADLPAEPAPGREVALSPTRAATLFGDVRQEGAWKVPAEGRWLTMFGDVVLDLRDARVAGGEVRIQAGTVFGDIDLLVPEGVEVEVRSWTLFGDVKQNTAAAAPGAPRIVLTGGTLFGDVEVRARRLRERLTGRRAAQ